MELRLENLERKGHAGVLGLHRLMCKERKTWCRGGNIEWRGREDGQQRTGYGFNNHLFLLFDYLTHNFYFNINFIFYWLIQTHFIKAFIYLTLLTLFYLFQTFYLISFFVLMRLNFNKHFFIFIFMIFYNLVKHFLFRSINLTFSLRSCYYILIW